MVYIHRIGSELSSSVTTSYYDTIIVVITHIAEFSNFSDQAPAAAVCCCLYVWIDLL